MRHANTNIAVNDVIHALSTAMEPELCSWEGGQMILNSSEAASWTCTATCLDAASRAHGEFEQQPGHGGYLAMERHRAVASTSSMLPRFTPYAPRLEERTTCERTNAVNTDNE